MSERLSPALEQAEHPLAEERKRRLMGNAALETQIGLDTGTGSQNNIVTDIPDISKLSIGDLIAAKDALLKQAVGKVKDGVINNSDSTGGYNS